VGITELNLSTCQSNTLVDRINAVPGLKTSAGKIELLLVFVLQHLHATFVPCLFRFNHHTSVLTKRVAGQFNATSHRYIGFCRAASTPV
jgi:hypothetical protein